MDEGRDADETPLWRIEERAIAAGVLGGLLAGVPMGLLYHLGTDIMPLLGTFLGASSALRGWVVHLVVSAFLGGGFAMVVGYPAIKDFIGSFGVLEYVLAGVTYTYAFVAVTVGILPFVVQVPWATVVDPLMPTDAGVTATALLPAAVFAVAHLVYGAILGGVYAVAGATR